MDNQKTKIYQAEIVFLPRFQILVTNLWEKVEQPEGELTIRSWEIKGSENDHEETVK